MQSIWFSCSLNTVIIESYYCYIEFLESLSLSKFHTIIDSSFEADANNDPFKFTATFRIHSE